MTLASHLAAALTAVALATAAMAAKTPSLAATTGPAELSPRNAGARYGQAAGVALVCYGIRTTAAIEPLKSRFTGADLLTFNEEAEKVLASWRDLQTCRDSSGPNECRLTQVWSCRDALREIGPNGTALPGLVETKAE